MKIHDVQQGSPEWMKLRAGIPTASEFDALVSPEWKIREGEGVKTYLAKKVAEKWLGGPLPDLATFHDMEQGQIMEESAIPWYALTYGVDVKRVGFITDNAGTCGCSPDGMVQDGLIGLEIKCPAAHTQAGYLLANELPKQYRAQVHGSMYVTGAPFWTFVSYRRKFPALVLTVERDEKAIRAIHEAVQGFNDQLEKAFKTLQEREK